MTIELEKIYSPHEIEDRFSQRWIEQGISTAPENPEGRTPYSIVIPPPNVTGSLHLGHALNNTLQDILARYHRMKGDATLWVFGTDHAGIATQNVVERQLAGEGSNRYDLGREAFVDRVWKWKAESGGTITRQLKRLGASLDWSRERFTMDEGLSNAVREVFVTLYEQGLLYRDQRLIHWCPRCQTSLSDLEVEFQEVKGHLWHIRYRLFTEESGEDPQHFLTVATTRPETLLGDSAVAVHPDDERYQALVGKTVMIPFAKRLVPIIADAYVDQAFGSGVVKITPAHDFNDFEVGKRHNLERINVLQSNGKMNEAAGQFQNMDRFECRKQIVKLLEESGDLEKIEDHKLNVGHCYRCKTVVEPYLSLQWFVKTKPLAEPAMEAVKSGKTKFYPEHWEKTYFSWMENIKDWCVSRQIWWGHRIPAWYCSKSSSAVLSFVGASSTCHSSTPRSPSSDGLASESFSAIPTICPPIVSRETPAKCPHCGDTELTQDPDVLDTWFSSALWPFSTLGWPEKTKLLESYYPTSVLVTGFDIIFFWVARMMMMGIHFMGEVPFRDVYIHALVRDAQGQKMSKSKGNVIEPLALMEKFGTDALRFTLAAFAAQGRDIKLDEARVEGYRNFCNKIWNAARFLFSTCLSEEGPLPDPLLGKERELDHPPSLQRRGQGGGLSSAITQEDQWIEVQLSQTTQKVTEAINAYKYNEAALALYQFVWHVFCDWYLELIKTRLYSEGEQKVQCARFALKIFDQTLRLLHPFMPFITEELWQKMRGDTSQSIAVQKFPVPLSLEKMKEYGEAKEILDATIAIYEKVRQIRTETGIKPSLILEEIVVSSADTDFLKVVSEVAQRSLNLIRVKTIGLNSPIDRNGFARGVTSYKDIVVYIDLNGIADLEKEKQRQQKELARFKTTHDFNHKRLQNPEFRQNAPAELIQEKEEEQVLLSKKMDEIEESLKYL